MPNWKKVIVSGSNVSQLNNDGVYLRTTGDGVISSSAQIAGEISGAFTAPSGGFSTRITSLETAGGTTFSSSIASRVTNVETDLNTLESKTLVSSSAQLTTEFDTRYLNTSGDGVISSSAQVDHDSTTNFVANEHIDHTTVSISAGSGLSGGGTIAATRTLTLDTSSAHFTDGVKTKLNTEGVISSSAQLTSTFDTRYLNTIGDNVLSSSAQIAGEISGAFTATSGGLSTRITSLEAAGGTTFSSSVSTRLTNVEGYTLDNVTDNGSSTTNVITVGGLTVNGNATITGTLTAQQFNTEFVSSSIIFESGSTKFGDSVDDIHSFTGSVKLNTQTAATTDTDKFLVFDTGGEIKYRTGAEVLSDINPGGLVSSSAQLTTEFDTRYLNTTGDGVISSSAQVTISSTTGFTTFSSSIATSITSVSNIVNGGGGTFTSITLGPPSPQTSNYATVDSTASGSFVLHGTSNYVLDTFYTGSAVEYNYVARDGIKTGRMGTIKVISAFANYSNGEISFYETSTPDIDPVGASTNGLVFSFDSNGSGSNTGRFLVSNTTGTNLIVVFERKEWNLVY